MKASELWVNGEICLSLEGSSCFLLEKPQESNSQFGSVKKGHVSLTPAETERLIADLQIALYNYNQLDSLANQYQGDE